MGSISEYGGRCGLKIFFLLGLPFIRREKVRSKILEEIKERTGPS